MVLTVNGERQILDVENLTSLIAALGYDGAFVAVAVNRDVVRRAEWAGTVLAEGDSVEILTPRQGG